MSLKERIEIDLTCPAHPWYDGTEADAALEEALDGCEICFEIGAAKSLITELDVATAVAVEQGATDGAEPKKGGKYGVPKLQR